MWNTQAACTPLRKEKNTAHRINQTLSVRLLVFLFVLDLLLSIPLTPISLAICRLTSPHLTHRRRLCAYCRAPGFDSVMFRRFGHRCPRHRRRATSPLLDRHSMLVAHLLNPFVWPCQGKQSWSAVTTIVPLEEAITSEWNMEYVYVKGRAHSGCGHRDVGDG